MVPWSTIYVSTKVALSNLAITQTMTVSVANGSVLIVGATGFIGRFLADASLDAGRPTYVLVKPSYGNQYSKDKVAKALQERGAILLNVQISYYTFKFVFVLYVDASITCLFPGIGK